MEPRGSYNCVMNVVITDKRNGQIVRKTNNTPKNPGMNGKQFHVQTPQDIHHILKEATIFSEMDMGWGFTNLFKKVFLAKQGLQRMKRIYFDPTASSGTFHSKVRKVLAAI